VRVERAVSRPAVRPAYDLWRLDDPWLVLAGDAEGEDRLTGWSTDDDADVLAELTAGEFGACY
jgi:hypothetical protein